MKGPIERNIETALSLSGIHVELVGFERTGSFTGVFETDDCHALSMSLMPQAASSHGAYLDAAGLPGPWGTVGIANFCPAGCRLLVSASTATMFRSIRICYRPEIVVDTIGSIEHWSKSELLAALDLRSSVIRRDLLRIVQEMSAAGRLREKLIESAARVVLVEMARTVDEMTASSVQTSNGPLAAWQMRRIRDRVEAMIGHVPSVDELAHACKISSRHLMRIFKSATGHTLGEYIGEVRVAKAKSLLAETDLPQKKIAGRLGYSSSGTFCTAFGKAVGMTPKQFRNRHRYYRAA